MKVRKIEKEELRNIIESLLFVSDEAVSLKKFAEILGVSVVEVEEILKNLKNTYQEENRGFQLREVAGGYRLFTHPANASFIEKFVVASDFRKLTQAALETLAIIAYKQPVTKSEISAIRGVNIDTVLNSLIEKDLVKEVGRESVPGQPILYGTTKVFLEALGFKSLDDLPPLEEFEPDEETRRQLELKLTAEQPEDSQNGG